MRMLHFTDITQKYINLNRLCVKKTPKAIACRNFPTQILRLSGFYQIVQIPEIVMQIHQPAPPSFGRLQNPELVRIARGIRHNMLQQEPASRPTTRKIWPRIRYTLHHLFRQFIIRLTELIVPATPSERIMNKLRKLPYNL